MAAILDETDGLRRRAGGVVFETEAEGQEEEDLRVRLAGDLGIERRVDRQRDIAPELRELVNAAVVHPQPASVAKRVAVCHLHRGADRGAYVREEMSGADVLCELAQILVVPGRLDASKDAGGGRGVIPADPEPIAVRGLCTEPRVHALVDERMGGRVERLLEWER